MSSISKIIRNNNVQVETKSDCESEYDFETKSEVGSLNKPLELKRTVHLTEPEMVKEPEPEPEKFKNIIFVSDVSISPNIRQQLADYKGIREFDRDLFTNRTCSDLFTNHEVSHIWVCLKNRHGRDWLSKHLLTNDLYELVAVYAGDKQQKWLDDLKDHIDLTIKISDLNKLKSLTYGELVDNLQSLEIHQPISKILSCLGISKGRLTKKKNSNY